MRILFEGFFWFLARFGLVQPLKRANIGYQDFWDKSFGRFFGFQYTEMASNLQQQYKGFFLPEGQKSLGQSSPQELEKGEDEYFEEINFV